jgi:hypothetical protein
LLDRIFTILQQRQILTIKLEVLSLDSTSVKVHPDGTGALKKPAHKPWFDRLSNRMVAASDRIAMRFALSGGEKHDAPQGRKLIEELKTGEPCSLLMDRAYEDDKTRALAIESGFTPVVIEPVEMLFLQRKTDLSLGITIKNCISVEMKSRGCLGDLKRFVGYLQDTKNLMLCTWLSLLSH